MSLCRDCQLYGQSDALGDTDKNRISVALSTARDVFGASREDPKEDETGMCQRPSHALASGGYIIVFADDEACPFFVAKE